jgi:hypothetical protein
MIMTQNKIMEGYRTLRNEFDVSPEKAVNAMAIVQEFCKNRKCPECLEKSGSCTDCRGRQDAENRMNIKGFYSSSSNNEDGIFETIAEIGRTMKESNQIKKSLVKDLNKLTKKMARRNEFKVSDSFFKMADKINKKMSKIDFGGSENRDRLDLIESKFRNNSGSKSYNKIFDITDHKIIPLPKRKTFLTRYERGHSWAGSETAGRMMG